RCPNYGINTELMDKVRRHVINKSRDDIDWINRTADSSLGYILFKNGIYNSKTNTFVNVFDHKIVFHHRVPYDFPERNEEDIKYVRNLLFEKSCSNPEGLIRLLGCAIVGHKLKYFVFCPGVLNAGKSMLAHALKTCFGSFVK